MKKNHFLITLFLLFFTNFYLIAEQNNNLISDVKNTAIDFDGWD